MKKVNESVTGHRKYTYLLPFLLQNRSAVIGHSSQGLVHTGTKHLKILFNVHSLLPIINVCICQLYNWVHICEKQLLKLIMNLLIYYTLTGLVYLALKNFPSADIARQTHLLLSSTLNFWERPFKLSCYISIEFVWPVKKIWLQPEVARVKYNYFLLSRLKHPWYINVCGRKKNLNRTLEIESPLQTLTVGHLVEFID